MNDKPGNSAFLSSAPISGEPPTAARTVSAKTMSSAPLVYSEDGNVAWGEMWGVFCELASAGGPPHRGTMLFAPRMEDPTSPAYQQVSDELIRGIHLVSGLKARPVKPGWLAVECATPAQARWMSEQIIQENVESSASGNFLYLPVSASFTLSSEIKNVITVVAKTSHYWQDHIQSEVKTIMIWEDRILGALRVWKKSKR